MGQPFDVVKVRYQTPSYAGKYSSVLGAFRESSSGTALPLHHPQKQAQALTGRQYSEGGKGARAVQGGHVANGMSAVGCATVETADRQAGIAFVSTSFSAEARR